jgi:undecaprenyl-diphosphatase
MRRAILLGLIQGPTEMAPISSSAHTVLLQRRLRSAHLGEQVAGDGEREAAFQKSLQVALHAGTAIALGLQMGGSLRESFRRTCASSGERAPLRRIALLGLSALPPALAGYALERPIEQHLRGRRSIAAGLALGALAMAAADRGKQEREVEQARVADGLALGVAQAIALMPGVSRRGATLAAARARGLSRRGADELSWLAAVPVILGACVLKGARLAQGQSLDNDQRATLLAGAGASFLSTLLSTRLQAALRLGQAPLAPFCLYRVAIAGWTLALS